jgi:hypothetical protein
MKNGGILLEHYTVSSHNLLKILVEIHNLGQAISTSELAY